MREEYGWAKTVTDGHPGDPKPFVFVHIKKSARQGDWLNVMRTFLRVPVVGEYIALNDGSALFKVEAVVHCPFEASVGAEIWCSPADYHAMIKSLDLDAAEQAES